MEQFNLEKYKTLVAEGKTPRIVTRDGRSVRVVCTDRKCQLWPVIALIQEDDGTEHVKSFTADGSLTATYENDDLDLFFADPEPTYRPYKDAEECFKYVVRHGGWVLNKADKGHYLQIVDILNGGIIFGNGVETSFASLLEYDTWANDGSPCGVKEDN